MLHHMKVTQRRKSFYYKFKKNVAIYYLKCTNFRAGFIFAHLIFAQILFSRSDFLYFRAPIFRAVKR